MPHRDYSHYRNLAQQGCVFATTTCLDFVHAFARPDLADIMAASILNDCRHHGSKLSGFVVMPHHIHLLFVLPEKMSASRFMERVKSNSARRLLPWLGQELDRKFDVQRKLNGRVFWQRSFRSVSIDSEKEWGVKLDYIHLNPVRAGLVERPEDYRWSSMKLRLEQRWSEDRGLHIDQEMIEAFCAPSFLELRQAKSESYSALHSDTSSLRPSRVSFESDQLGSQTLNPMDGLRDTRPVSRRVG